jgi:hypothetical protein
MRAVSCGLLAAWFLAFAGAIRADDQADAKAIIDKALKAMGGADKVAKFKAGSWKAKATGEEGGNKITLTTEATWQGLDKIRVDADAEFNGMTKKALFVINGDKGWMKHDEMVRDAPEGELPVIKEAFYALRMPHLLPGLKDKAFTLSPLGETKVNDKPAVGITVAHKDHKDVSVHFDKETGLPVKSEVRVTNPGGKEFAIEYVYSDFKETDGVKHPMKITIKADREEVVVEVNEIKAKDKVEESEFAKP